VPVLVKNTAERVKNTAERVKNTVVLVKNSSERVKNTVVLVENPSVTVKDADHSAPMAWPQAARAGFRVSLRGIGFAGCPQNHDLGRA
jgi:hypothetical protein